MNKALTVALSKLFNIDETVIVESLSKEDGDDSLIKDFTSKNQVYSLENLSILLKNSNKQFLEKADFDINEVPKALYSKIAAAVLESKEKALSKEFGINEYSNLTDLFQKAVESKTGKGVDELSKKQIEALKETVKTLELEKESVRNEERTKYDSEFISRDFQTALQSLPLKAEADVLEKKKQLLSSAFSNDFKIARKEGKTVVLDNEGNVITNKLQEPETLSNVLTTHAKGYGFEFNEPDTGGRGATSSQSKLSLKGKSFDEVLISKGINRNTEDGDKIFLEWKAENQK